MKTIFYALWDDVDNFYPIKHFFCYYEVVRANLPKSVGGTYLFRDQFVSSFGTCQDNPPKDFSKTLIKLFKTL